MMARATPSQAGGLVVPLPLGGGMRAGPRSLYLELLAGRPLQGRGMVAVAGFSYAG